MVSAACPACKILLVEANDDTFGPGTPKWQVAGGTSASSPLIASIYALAGTPGPSGRPNSYPFAHRLNFWDIDRGIAGVSCPGNTYLCRAVRGDDSPTCVGTPAESSACGADTRPGRTVKRRWPGLNLTTAEPCASRQHQGSHASASPEEST
ncbi:hypothetical protein ACFVFI_09470 [Streptomyces sp. NPDC057705]|uniref:hypothetical protein n=1 Tax=Streptomyces sp. NPDC057705 TaxID=3346222 RepID=UPI003699861E